MRSAGFSYRDCWVFTDLPWSKLDHKADLTTGQRQACDRAIHRMGRKRMQVGSLIITTCQVMALPDLRYDLNLAIVEDIELLCKEAKP